MSRELHERLKLAEQPDSDGNMLYWCSTNHLIPEIQVLRDFCFDANDDPELRNESHARKEMSTRSAALGYLSIVSGYCMGLALVHAGTANAGVKHAICTYLTMLLRLRSGRLNKIQKQARLSEPHSTSNVFYSAAFMKACSERSSKVLVDMFLSCLSLSAGLVMSGTGNCFCEKLCWLLCLDNIIYVKAM